MNNHALASASEKNKLHEFTLNFLCILGGYIIGTGSRNISKLISVMGIEGAL